MSKMHDMKSPKFLPILIPGFLASQVKVSYNVRHDK
uniref:Uncharacterized protein n=1 Tax=Anguilla anguilla TaxID=7936 RepID=A0A0E9S8Y2_ANGAN